MLLLIQRPAADINRRKTKRARAIARRDHSRHHLGRRVLSAPDRAAQIRADLRRLAEVDGADDVAEPVLGALHQIANGGNEEAARVGAAGAEGRDVAAVCFEVGVQPLGDGRRELWVRLRDVPAEAARSGLALDVHCGGRLHVDLVVAVDAEIHGVR